MSDYVGDKIQEGWHLDKKVPLSLIAAMIAQVIVVTMFFADIKRDVELLKSDVIHLNKKDISNEESMKDMSRSINDQLIRLDAKLDRLIERQNNINDRKLK